MRIEVTRLSRQYAVHASEFAWWFRFGRGRPDTNYCIDDPADTRDDRPNHLRSGSPPATRLHDAQATEYLESEYRESQGEARRELQLVLDPDFL